MPKESLIWLWMVFCLRWTSLVFCQPSNCARKKWKPTRIASVTHWVLLWFYILIIVHAKITTESRVFFFCLFVGTLKWNNWSVDHRPTVWCNFAFINVQWWAATTTIVPIKLMTMDVKWVKKLLRFFFVDVAVVRRRVYVQITHRTHTDNFKSH